MTNLLQQAFPEQDISTISYQLNGMKESDEVRLAYWDNKSFTIPYRIYGALSNFHQAAQLSEKERILFYCLYSRHSDGYVRQRMVKKLTNLPFNKVIVPYVFLLLGEYVLEIFDDIYLLIKENKTVFIDFIRQNQDMYKLTYQRMVSYWNEYYRYSYPLLDEYLGKKIFSLLDAN